MCTNPRTIRVKPSPMDLYKGLYSEREIQVPCGKCAECLAKRQNDLMIRVYEESQHHSPMVFCTLTYAKEYEPIAQSLWAVDKETGEYERVFEPTILDDDLDTLDIVRGAFAPRGVRIDERKLDVEDERYEYIMRYTPSLYYRDVQLALKRFRKKHPDYEFSYVFVGEYGANPHKSMRPHYHCIFFGLTLEQVNEFTEEWKPDLTAPFCSNIHKPNRNALGYVYNKLVMTVNEDGSDGRQKVARYVGKYCAKGKFDLPVKRDGLTLSTRIRVSKGLGVPDSSIEALRRKYLALDTFVYNPDNLHGLSSDMIRRICEKIVSRLHYDFNGYPYALPNSFKRKIFGWRIVSTSESCPAQFKFASSELCEKGVYYPIYYAVQTFVRDRLLQEDARKFEAYRIRFKNNLAEAVRQFELDKQLALQNREKNKEATILRFYQQHSKI